MRRRGRLAGAVFGLSPGSIAALSRRAPQRIAPGGSASSHSPGTRHRHRLQFYPAAYYCLAIVRARDVQYLAADGDGSVVAADGGRQLARITSGWLVNVATLPRESRVEGLATIWDGSVAIADSGLCRIWRFDSRSRLHVLAGVEQPPALDRKATRADGPAGVARFRSPIAIAADGSGAILVAESEESRTLLRRVVDGSVTTVEATSVPPVGASAISRFGADRLVLVSSSGPPAVFVLRPDGTIWTLDRIVGSERQGGREDGPAADARFVAPAALASTADGCAVADGARVRWITSGFDVSTLAGAEPGCEDGPAAAARFGRIAALAATADGRIYIADPDNDAVRVFAEDGTVTTAVGANRTGGIPLGGAAVLQAAFGSALVDDDTNEAWELARVFLREHRRHARTWPDRTVQPTSAASARLGKALATTWSQSEDPERAAVGLFCLWLIGCEERDLGANEIRDHRLSRMLEELERLTD